MDNCEHCQWRKDLIKMEFIDGKTINTRLGGFACIAPSPQGDVLWLNGISDYNGYCTFFTPEEE